ncbi:MAG: hypothetical protein ACFFDK_18200 [Promethearchaeota archaeon]
MIINEIKFPIEGPLREPLLIIEWVIVLLFFEMAAIFMVKVIKKEKKERNQQERAYIMLFLGYSLMWVFIIFGDFYAETLHNRLIFLSIGFLIILYCQLVFFYRMEKNQIFLKRYLFTKSFIIMIFISAIVLIVNINLTETVAYSLYMSISILFWIIYLKRLITNPDIKIVQNNLSLVVLIFSVGFILTAIGFIFTIDFVINSYGLEFRLFGDIIQLIGFCFIFLFFNFVPSLSEYDWKDKLDRLFIMLKSGICIYYKFFKDGDDLIDEQSITGVTKSINDVLNEITDKEGVSIIERRHKTFIIQPSTYITGVLVCDEKLDSLKLLLSRFIDRIESTLINIFEDWNLEMKIFNPIDGFAKEIFLF